MIKKIIVFFILLASLESTLSAKDKIEYLDLKKSSDIDKLGWIVYRSNFYDNSLKYNRLSKIKSWYLKTYHGNEYKKNKNDEFALNDLKAKSDDNFLKKIKSINPKTIYTPYHSRKKPKTNYMFFKLDLMGKIGKYNFDKQAFIIIPNKFRSKGKELISNVHGYISYTDNNDSNRKFVKNINVNLSSFYLKMNKDNAKTIHDKFKDKEVLLRYKLHYAEAKNSLPSNTGAWMNLSIYRINNEINDSVEIIDPENNTTIGIAKPLKY